MEGDLHGKRVEAFCIGLVAGWELVAFTTRRVPTVTAVVMRLPHGPRAVLVGAVWVWTVIHFELKGVTWKKNSVPATPTSR